MNNSYTKCIRLMWLDINQLIKKFSGVKRLTEPNALHTPFSSLIT